WIGAKSSPHIPTTSSPCARSHAASPSESGAANRVGATWLRRASDPAAETVPAHDAAMVPSRHAAKTKLDDVRLVGITDEFGVAGDVQFVHRILLVRGDGGLGAPQVGGDIVQ